jgi:biopolymer transport protein ExbD
MKQMIIAMCLCIAGCGYPVSEPATFADAVRASVREYAGHTHIVLDVHPDGSFTIAGRPTEVEELRQIAGVPGTPQPPRVLVEVHRKANHETIQSISDTCRSNGVEIVIVKGIFKGEHNKRIHGI